MERNTAQAKKMFFDWMDRTRPWNTPGLKDNMYALMEEITRQAAWHFHGERTYTATEAAKWETDALRLTELLDEHPADYDGPCACSECRSLT